MAFSQNKPESTSMHAKYCSTKSTSDCCSIVSTLFSWLPVKKPELYK